MAAHPAMPNMHALYGEPQLRDAYQGTHPPAVAEIRKPASLVSLTRERDHLLLAIDDAGVVEQFRVTTLDAPGLDLLAALDRSSVQSALAAIDRERADAA